MLMDGGEGNIRINSCVIKDIEHQWEKKENNERKTEDGGVFSPMSVTRSNTGIWEGGGR